MSHSPTRRKFLATTAAAGVGYWVAGGVSAQESKSPNARIRFACIGVGGKGSSDTANASRHGDIVAICDVDRTRLDGAKRKYGKTVEDRTYTDFRKLLEENKDRIDAVTVSTPDHVHAVASAMAMRMGKHCFTQKPLTHDVFEARTLAKIAKEKNLGTQMGNQGVANSGARKAAAVVQAGALGALKEVHVWTDRPIWPQGGPRPAASAPPAHVDWESWIGPAPMRPFAKGYHPFAWRGWWDFGTGALGDMACHNMNMPFWAADLRDPIAISAENSPHNKDSFPKWSVITYEFAKTEKRPAIKLYWYDGGKRPPKDLFGKVKLDKNGTLIVGDKGKLYAARWGGDSYTLFDGAEEPAGVTFEKSPGHVEEWVRAIRGGQKASSDFVTHSGALTETVLLGNLAVWSGKRVEWDAKNMKAKGMPELDPLLKREYRKGYTL